MEATEPRPWAETPITLEKWRRAEVRILRGIARRCAAVLQEAGDPAMVGNNDELRALLVEWQAWRNYGLGRNWQP